MVPNTMALRLYRTLSGELFHEFAVGFCTFAVCHYVDVIRESLEYHCLFTESITRLKQTGVKIDM